MEETRPWLKVPPPRSLPLSPVGKLPPLNTTLDAAAPRPDPRDQRPEARRPASAPHHNDA